MDKSRCLHSGNIPLNTSLATIEQEGAALIQRAAARAPAKIVAIKTGMTERNVRSMRQREHQPRWINFIALARECPELRAFIGRLLALETLDPATEALVEQVRKYAASRMEEGDREQP